MSNLPPTSQEIELQARLDDNPGSVVCGRCDGTGEFIPDDPAARYFIWACPDCDGEGIVKP